MGLLAKLVSKGAEKIVPKILIGKKDDRQAVQKVIAAKPEAFTPIFDKFGKSVETGVKLAVAIGGAALTLGAAAPAIGATTATTTGAVGGGGVLSNVLKSSLPQNTGINPLTGLAQNIVPINPVAGLGSLTKLTTTAAKVVDTTKTIDVSLLGSLGQAALEAAKPAIQNVASGLLSNLLKPSLPQNTGINPAAASQQAFDQASVGNLRDRTSQYAQQTPAEAAVFGSNIKGVRYTITDGGFWEENKAWLMPVSIIGGIIVAVITIIKLFFSKR